MTSPNSRFSVHGSGSYTARTVLPLVGDGVAVELATGREWTLEEITELVERLDREKRPRNRTREQRAEAGLVSLSLDVQAWVKAALQAAATARGVSLAGLITKFAETLAKSRTYKK